MKKRVLLITFIIAIIMSMFATTAVFATGDDHGEDAHSDSMAVLEEDDYGDEDLSFKAMKNRNTKGGTEERCRRKSTRVKGSFILKDRRAFINIFKNEKTPLYIPNPNQRAHSRFFKALSHIEFIEALSVDQRTFTM